MGYWWYHTTLDKEERQIYGAIMQGLLNGEPNFRVPKGDPGRLSALFELVRMDAPEIFYVEGFQFRSVRSEPTLLFSPRYTFQAKQREQMMHSLDRRASAILAPMVAMTAKEALSAIHEFVLSGIIYEKKDRQYSHEIPGVLHHGIGVCEGISKTVKFLCDRLDIPCIIAISDRLPENGRERHAWNVIRCDGAWRHYDFTFDLTASRDGYASYRFLAMDDEECFRTHAKPCYPLPPCLPDAP